RSFLFLGFGLRHWPLRILLHALRGSSSQRRSFAMEEFRNATPKDVEEAVYFWGRGHKIHLFAQDVPHFISELHRRWVAEGGSVARPSVDAARPGDEKPTAFLSYASQDEERVTWLRDGLRARGVEPWHDKEGLRGGDDWAAVLESSVEGCDYFVLCQSQALAQRAFSYVHKEIKYARDRQTMAAETVRYMVPLLLDDVAPMDKLSDIQSMKMHGDDDLDRLAKIIKRDFQRRKRL
ncbi:MAG: toll/interleukin-1 receptor domain-containing protein, partial [Deltaproteobacteria bacterium]|nr:toll/interleukin-1 receptor domain-containing protein [Deltaproteobacteria bacterium]